MENSFFIYTDGPEKLLLERFHVCTWEFKNSSSLVEFGFEIEHDSIISKDRVTINMLIPWLKSNCKVEDLFGKLKDSDNSRFIFNDSIKSSTYLEERGTEVGVIHKFSDRKELCLLPIKYEIKEDRFLEVSIDLKKYQEIKTTKANVYIRLWIEPSKRFISLRKNGIGKSTIIYDTKINERRNITKSDLSKLSNKQLCEIKTCFMFNILPNNYEIVFFDNKTLKNIRTLEYEAFSKYLGDNRIQKNELLVVFNKRDSSESFSFFSVFSKERIGPGQFALAVFINILCGILLYIPSYRKSFQTKPNFLTLVQELPTEIWFAISIAIITFIYFIWPIFKRSK